MLHLVENHKDGAQLLIILSKACLRAVWLGQLTIDMTLAVGSGCKALINGLIIYKLTGGVRENQKFGLRTRSDTNRPVQSQKQARSLKFRIRAAKTRALISYAVTAQLICGFVFAYAKCWFSHAVAHMNVLFQYIFSLVGSCTVHFQFCMSVVFQQS